MGYRLTQSTISKAPGREPVRVVLHVRDPEERARWVTWLEVRPEDGRKPFRISGRYFLTEMEALDDYFKRTERYGCKPTDLRRAEWHEPRVLTTNTRGT